ncbi:PREDICTED: uncharacterized protein LOC108545745 isoform X2 [Eufriesea mexicana]|nr:PREDICTED: uncharacterized protein LOC108545745 isoform X2 [Eufriesea mexicana]
MENANGGVARETGTEPESSPRRKLNAETRRAQDFSRRDCLPEEDSRNASGCLRAWRVVVACLPAFIPRSRVAFFEAKNRRAQRVNTGPATYHLVKCPWLNEKGAEPYKNGRFRT